MITNVPTTISPAAIAQAKDIRPPKPPLEIPNAWLWFWGVLIALALVIGVSATFGFTTFLSSLLFGVEAGDPITMIGVAALLAVIAIIASVLPAWRASRLDPSRTLRALD